MLQVEFGMAFEEPDAAVPSQDAVVVAGRADFFCFRETVESFFKKGQENVGCGAGAKLSLGAPFQEQTGVIEALVRITQSLKKDTAFSETVAGIADELVGNRQAEHASSKLMVRIDGQDIAADGLRFFGLIEIAIQLDFGNGF